MSSLAYLDRAREWAKVLEDDAVRATGRPLPEVRPAVARDVGCAPGTLENLRKRRLKKLDWGIVESLRRAVDRRLENLLRRLEHERHLNLQQGLDPRSDDFAANTADIEAVRKALGLPALPGEGGGT